MLIFKVSSKDGAENEFETILNVNAREVNATFIKMVFVRKNTKMEKTDLETFNFKTVSL